MTITLFLLYCSLHVMIHCRLIVNNNNTCITLGFSVSGRNTDSESDHLVINSESEMERERRKNETETKFKKAKKGILQ